ncbi:hypothetical protein ANN_04653 [Periplaneta americana]|uniref:Uncharacterized protein n=1 Tax=Periplaneta americana TaxID=6978 RepID=A0ABQ8T932_PERAM|nr:hypothetical protein ANN_04653 [Periplaneta americana]
MPKIFLIKNRLHLQQQRLLETQKRPSGPGDGGGALTPPGSPLSPPDAACQPLSLIVHKTAGYLASELDEGDNVGEMSPGSSTDSNPVFAHIGLRENPGKNLNQKQTSYKMISVPRGLSRRSSRSNLFNVPRVFNTVVAVNAVAGNRA